MKIKKLMNKLNLSCHIVHNHTIHSIERISQNVCKKDIFIAIKGSKNDGHNFIEEAIKNGACTIFYQDTITFYQENINYIKVEDTKKILADIANVFFNYVTRKIKMIGITGTNGKTTISTLLFNFLEYNGKKALLIGTNGIFLKNDIFKTENTTPDALTTTKVIYEAYKKKVEYCIMEVSSHAIKELRVRNFDFDIVIFSNLTHEHLDYHKSMIDYLYTKGLLIHGVANHKNKFVILNKDDHTFELYNQLANARVISYGIREESDFQAINILKSLENGTQFKVVNHLEKFKVKTFLLGDFNVYNVLSCIVCVSALNLKIEEFVQFLKVYVSVSGRMEMIKYNNKTIVIDYAHTPDGVLNVVTNLSTYANNKLTVIFGCGGNRDKEKRAIMGGIATKYANKVILTNDNPRDEADMNIIQDILKGIENNNYIIELDREKAIERAIKESEDFEIIAILGKGNEEYQIINGIKYPFNDKEVVKKIINRRTSNESS